MRREGCFKSFYEKQCARACHHIQSDPLCHLAKVPLQPPLAPVHLSRPTWSHSSPQMLLSLTLTWGPPAAEPSCGLFPHSPVSLLLPHMSSLPAHPRPLNPFSPPFHLRQGCFTALATLGVAPCALSVSSGWNILSCLPLNPWRLARVWRGHSVSIEAGGVAPSSEI